MFHILVEVFVTFANNPIFAELPDPWPDFLWWFRGSDQTCSSQGAINPAGGRVRVLICNNGNTTDPISWSDQSSSTGLPCCLPHQQREAAIWQRQQSELSKTEERFNWRVLDSFGTMRYRKTLSTEIKCGGNKVLSGMSCKSVTSWVPQIGCVCVRRRIVRVLKKSRKD